MFSHGFKDLLSKKTVKTGIAGLIASVLIGGGVIPAEASDAVTVAVISLLGIFLRDAV